MTNWLQLFKVRWEKQDAVKPPPASSTFYISDAEKQQTKATLSELLTQL